MATKTNSIETNWARAPPPSGPVWQTICRAIYNPEEKSFLGRTPKRWGIAIIFYLIFYAVLAVLFSTCMAGLFFTIENDKPSYILERSLIGVNPGVAFRPRPLTGGTLVRYAVENNSYYEGYIQQLDEYFEPYNNDKWYKEHQDCVSKDNYGFPQTPCLFIKLNKIYGWIPDCYNVTELPSDMPEDLVKHIQSLDPLEANQIWVTCWEESGNMTKIEYPWGNGLPSAFYPFHNTEGYRSPVVAVKVTPSVNTAVAIRCRAWAKNVRYNKSLKEPSGYTRIELFIEDNASAQSTEAPV